MSFVTTAFFNNKAILGRLGSGNGIMNANQQTMNMIGKPGGSPASIFSQERALNIGRENNKFMYKANSVMEESNNNLMKNLIKRAFSTFA